MDPRFFIVRPRGGEDGPFTEEEILDLLDSGELSRNDWCRVDALPHAQPLGEIFETIRITPAELRDDEEVPETRESDDDAGEEILYRGAPSFLGYGGPLMVAAGTLGLGYWAGAFGVAWVVSAVAIAFVLIARVLAHRAAREYLVTTERVESTCGLLVRRTQALGLDELASIQLFYPWPLGWFGVGTVVFSAESDNPRSVVFERVRGVRHIVARVRECQNP